MLEGAYMEDYILGPICIVKGTLSLTKATNKAITDETGSELSYLGSAPKPVKIYEPQVSAALENISPHTAQTEDEN